MLIWMPQVFDIYIIRSAVLFVQAIYNIAMWLIISYTLGDSQGEE
jgi:hypothetical protein